MSNPFSYNQLDEPAGGESRSGREWLRILADPSEVFSTQFSTVARERNRRIFRVFGSNSRVTTVRPSISGWPACRVHGRAERSVL